MVPLNSPEMSCGCDLLWTLSFIQHCRGPSQFPSLVRWGMQAQSSGAGASPQELNPEKAGLQVALSSFLCPRSFTSGQCPPAQVHTLSTPHTVLPRTLLLKRLTRGPVGLGVFAGLDRTLQFRLFLQKAKCDSITTLLPPNLLTNMHLPTGYTALKQQPAMHLQ